MSARDWLCVCLMTVGVLLFVVGWFVPKWTNLEPHPVIVGFGVAALIVFGTGAYNLGM